MTLFIHFTTICNFDCALWHEYEYCSDLHSWDSACATSEASFLVDSSGNMPRTTVSNRRSLPAPHRASKVQISTCMYGSRLRIDVAFFLSTA